MEAKNEGKKMIQTQQSKRESDKQMTKREEPLRLRFVCDCTERGECTTESAGQTQGISHRDVINSTKENINI